MTLAQVTIVFAQMIIKVTYVKLAWIMIPQKPPQFWALGGGKVTPLHSHDIIYPPEECGEIDFVPKLKKHIWMGSLYMMMLNNQGGLRTKTSTSQPSLLVGDVNRDV